MTAEHDPYEAGVGFAVRPAKGDFLGPRGAGGPQRARPRARRLACLTLDDPAAVVLGKEPVYVGRRPGRLRHQRRLRLHPRPVCRLRLAAAARRPPGPPCTSSTSARRSPRPSPKSRSSIRRWTASAGSPVGPGPVPRDPLALRTQKEQPHGSHLRRHRPRPRRHGQCRRPPSRRARRPGAGPGEVRPGAQPRLQPRRFPHHPAVLLRGPRLRTAAAALLRAVREAGAGHRPGDRHPLRRGDARPPRQPYRHAAVCAPPSQWDLPARDAGRQGDPPPLPDPHPGRGRGRAVRGTGRPGPAGVHRRRACPARHPGRAPSCTSRSRSPAGRSCPAAPGSASTPPRTPTPRASW